MKKKKNSKKNLPSDNQDDSKENKNLKEWKAPKLQLESTNNTLGGNFACNSVGDDAWYSS